MFTNFNTSSWPPYTCRNTIRYDVDIPVQPRPFTEQELLFGIGHSIGYDCKGGYFIHWIHVTNTRYVDGFKAIQLKYEQNTNTYRMTVWLKKANNSGPASITRTRVPMRRLFDVVKRVMNPLFPYVVATPTGNQYCLFQEDSQEATQSLINEISDDGVFMPGEAPWPPVLPEKDAEGNVVPPGTR